MASKLSTAASQLPATGAAAALVDSAISAIADAGLEGISLRTVASSASLSTATITHHFGDKKGLIDAAMASALEHEIEAHAAFERSVSGLVLDHGGAVNLVAHYIGSRAKDRVARFWTELLFKSRLLTAGEPQLAAWHDLRVATWRRVLEPALPGSEIASFLVTFLCMEEAYACTLVGDNLSYDLLQRETIANFLANAFAVPVGDTDDGVISRWLNSPAKRYSFEQPADASELSGRLLDLAVQDIVDEGIGALNQRRLTKLAGTSSSMIVYHFGDMASFVSDAVWRALRKGLPPELDPNQHGVVRQDTISDWADAHTDMIRPRTDDRRAGFYIGYARMSGQASLLVGRQPGLRSLVEHLRVIEGFGTYLSSQTVWPGSTKFTRGQAAAFGVWVKGQAVLNDAILRDEPAGPNTLLAAAALIGAR